MGISCKADYKPTYLVHVHNTHSFTKLNGSMYLTGCITISPLLKYEIKISI